MANRIRLFAFFIACAFACSTPATFAQGSLRVGTEVSYAPLEFYGPNHAMQGLDIELMRAIAAQMQVSLVQRDRPFGSLLRDVASGSLDAAISAISDTRARENQVDFIDYLRVGTGMLVPRGNPRHVFSLGDLCGLRVDVQEGTSSEVTLKKQSASCVSLGLGPVRVEGYATDPQASAAFGAGKSDVHVADYPVVAYLAQRSNGKFAVVGFQFDVVPYGIAVSKKKRALSGAMQRALIALVANGSYDTLLKKWNLGQGAMRGAPINEGRFADSSL